jgi:hypothetical protein
MQSEVPVRQPKPKPQRRSLPQAHPSTSSPFRSQSRSAAVLDHAADAIVNDLVVLDSPVAPSTKIIDPNSSFGKFIISLHFDFDFNCDNNISVYRNECLCKPKQDFAFS